MQFFVLGIVLISFFSCGVTELSSRYRDGLQVTFQGNVVTNHTVQICSECKNFTLGYRNLKITAGEVVIRLIQDNSTVIFEKVLNASSPAAIEYYFETINFNIGHNFQIEERSAQGYIEVYLVSSVNYTQVGSNGEWVDHSSDNGEGKPQK